MLTREEKIERCKIVVERMAALGQWSLAVWIGDDGFFRVGHSDDMRQMIDDLDGVGG